MPSSTGLHRVRRVCGERLGWMGFGCRRPPVCLVYDVVDITQGRSLRDLLGRLRTRKLSRNSNRNQNLMMAGWQPIDEVNKDAKRCNSDVDLKD